MKHEPKKNTIANCFVLITVYVYATPQFTFNLNILAMQYADLTYRSTVYYYLGNRLNANAISFAVCSSN